jgi:hypothetical protein
MASATRAFVEACLGQQDRKLLAAIASHQPAGFGGTTAQDLGQGLNHLVACDMAVRVVDGLEMVDVDQTSTLPSPNCRRACQDWLRTAPRGKA